MVTMNAYDLGKQAADPVVADPGTYWGRFKNMIRGSRVAPYALGSGVALGALYGVPKLVDKLMEPAAEELRPAEPSHDPRTLKMLEAILAQTAPQPAPVSPAQTGFSNDPASDNYWRQIAAVSSSRRNRDRQLLGEMSGEQR